MFALVALGIGGCGDDGASSTDAGPSADAGADARADAGPPPPSRPAEAPLVQWVDPFIGTGGLGFGVGSAFPGPQRPFGMVRPGPDTTAPDGAPGFNHCAGYWYDDPLIRGFSHTRMHGTGIADYGAVGIMPTVGMTADKTSHLGYRSAFSHDTEEASPGYYAVTLDDPNVRVELTAADYTAFHRYTFDASAGTDATVLIDAGYFMADLDIVDGAVTVDPTTREIHGFSHFTGGYSGRFGGMPVHFVARFSRDFAAHGVWKAGTLFAGETMRTGNDSGAWVTFDAGADPVVEVAVAVSFIDVAHARANLDAEIAPGFDGTRTATVAAWEEALARAEIEGRSERDFRIFYTALYHALLMPTLASESDGSYRGLDGEVHVADGFRYYTDFSLWDTYRTQHPLLVLLYPEYQTDMLRSLVAMANDGGYMPRWPLGIGYTGGMVGDSANVVFGDSVLKGVTDFDQRAAYDAMRRQAMEPSPDGAPYGGRSGIADYMALGYVPIEAGGSSASHTLEFAYDDYALAALAEALGETADAAMFRERAGNWRNLWEPEQQFLLGRHRDGTFPADVDPFVWTDFYAEGTAWQYVWFVPHDLEGLAEVMGGRDAFLGRLGMFFEQSERRPYMPFSPGTWYWHGNEPDLHAPWIFAALDDWDGAARWVRWAAELHYGDGPDGLPGNDDAGTMSAWYVFAALGVFPIAGTDVYLLASPIFTRATLHLPAGDFTIDAPDASERAIYVESATLNGAPLDRPRLVHADLAGATLSLDLRE